MGATQAMGRVGRAQSAPGPAVVFNEKLREIRQCKSMQTEQETEIEKKAA